MISGEVYDKVYVARQTLERFRIIVESFSELGIKVEENIANYAQYEITIERPDGSFSYVESLPDLIAFHDAFMQGYQFEVPD